jgi:hypothetical protein
LPSGAVSATIASGLTSTRSASLAFIVAYSPWAMATNGFSRGSRRPIARPSAAGLEGQQPELRIGDTRWIAPGFWRATSSISTPPSAEAMSTIRRLARSMMAPR